ncbi:DnaJ sub B member 6 [Dinochytrium kinnereticum]|nr:DnaJ sub B member 6 [Dinochytrium kinnereticum]
MEFYNILGINRDASQEDIKKAYKRAALNCHPDKVPMELREQAEAEFKLVSEAYEVLRDPRMRNIYDRHGVDGLKGGASAPDAGWNDQFNSFHHLDPRSLFEQVFGGRDPFADFHRSMFSDFGRDPFSSHRGQNGFGGMFGGGAFGGGGFGGGGFGGSSMSGFGGRDPFDDPFFTGPFDAPGSMGRGGNSGGFSSFSSMSSSGGRGGGAFSSTSTQTTIVNGERTTITQTRDGSGNVRTETVRVGRDGRETREIVENGQKVLEAGAGNSARGGRIRY